MGKNMEWHKSYAIILINFVFIYEVSPSFKAVLNLHSIENTGTVNTP